MDPKEKENNKGECQCNMKGERGLPSLALSNLLSLPPSFRRR